LENNQLKTLPNEIGQLENLQYLNLENNQLKTLPNEIGRLQNLKVLNLGGNQLVTLPQEIVGLKHLQILKLKNIPALLSEKETIRKLLPDVKVVYSKSKKRP
ncbi:leucine-rich repeat domain-containing protein, partial [Leptospira santarosai]